MKKIMTLSVKGGTGKSTTTLTLANMLSKQYKVGLLDCDTDSPFLTEHMFAGDSSKHIVTKDKKSKKYLPVKYSDNLSVFSILLYHGSGTEAYSLSSEMRQQLLIDAVKNTDWDDIDILMFDLPGGTAELSSICSELKGEIDGVIAVVQPNTTRGLLRIIQLCGYTLLPILGVIENMVDSHTECGVPAKCPVCGKVFSPFGCSDDSRIKEICINKGINYLGYIPLASNGISKTAILPDVLSGSVQEAMKVIVKRVMKDG